MELVTALSIFGVVVSAVLLGFAGGRARAQPITPEAGTGAGAQSQPHKSALQREKTARQPPEPPRQRPLSGVTIYAGVVLLGCSTKLAESPVVSPLLLQFALFALLPGLAGYAARRVVATRRSKKP